MEVTADEAPHETGIAYKVYRIEALDNLQGSAPVYEPVPDAPKSYAASDAQDGAPPPNAPAPGSRNRVTLCPLLPDAPTGREVNCPRLARGFFSCTMRTHERRTKTDP